MSQSTLATVRYEIKQLDATADHAKAELKELDRALLKAMKDKVGQRARESASGIARRFSYMAEAVIPAATQMADGLSRGYGQMDSLAAQGDQLLAEANSIAAGVGQL